MVLTQADYRLWKDLRDSGLIPPDPTVLEIGCANWYGDLDPTCLHADIDQYAEPWMRSELHGVLAEALKQTGQWWLFEVAEVFYDTFLRYKSIEAIDKHGPPHCLYRDLNHNVLGTKTPQHNILINSGTAEHIFNQGQFWQTCHEVVKPGGLMVHALPLWGWLDHGFYNYHPTFVADLAEANGYEILRWVFVQFEPFIYLSTLATGPKGYHGLAAQLGTNRSSMMYVVFRKAQDREFRVPQQGVYSERATDQQKADWLTKR
jgi:hypothetical protein